MLYKQNLLKAYFWKYQKSEENYHQSYLMTINISYALNFSFQIISQNKDQIFVLEQQTSSKWEKE